MDVYTGEYMDGIIPFMQIILGIGIDRVQIDRIERLMMSPRFLTRVFTKNECESFDKAGITPGIVAGVFVAKEAVSKALGTGFNGFTTRDVEVLPGTEGEPTVTLYGGAQTRFFDIGGARFHLSITCDDYTAMAMAVLEGGQ